MTQSVPPALPEDAGAAAPASPTVVIVSGLSGSGKSVALKTFEDLDYYCVDNLPVDLLPSFVRSLVREDELPPKIAVGIDARSRHSDLTKLAQWRAALAQLGLEGRVVFFDATDEVLLRRYSDTRRRHPLGHGGLSLQEAIRREREIIQPLRDEAEGCLEIVSERLQSTPGIVAVEADFDRSTLAVRYQPSLVDAGLPD